MNKYLSVRLNPKLREDFQQFCDGIGLSFNASVNLLVVECIKKGSIPFDIKIEKYKLDSEVHSERRSIWIDEQRRQEFSSFCKSNGLNMGSLIRLYMMKCLDGQEIPF